MLYLSHRCIIPGVAASIRPKSQTKIFPQKEEDGSSGACDLGAGGYCANISIWDSGRLLVATPGKYVN